MKNKVILYGGTIILTIILFTVSTIMQRKLIDYEPKIECLFAKTDIKENEKLNSDMFYKDEIDISLVASTQIVQNFSEIDGLYANSDVYKGQLVVVKQFDTKENLSIYEIEDGKEKISIKVKSSENGVSYSLKKGSLVNIYVTLRADIAEGFLEDKERLTIGTTEDGYTVIKLLQNIMVLESFDVDGYKIEDSESNVIDTIMVAVTSDEAKEINLLREIGMFNIVEINENKAVVETNEV